MVEADGLEGGAVVGLRPRRASRTTETSNRAGKHPVERERDGLAAEGVEVVEHGVPRGGEMGTGEWAEGRVRVQQSVKGPLPFPLSPSPFPGEARAEPLALGVLADHDAVAAALLRLPPRPGDLVGRERRERAVGGVARREERAEVGARERAVGIDREVGAVVAGADGAVGAAVADVARAVGVLSVTTGSRTAIDSRSSTLA